MRLSINFLATLLVQVKYVVPIIRVLSTDQPQKHTPEKYASHFTGQADTHGQ